MPHNKNNSLNEEEVQQLDVILERVQDAVDLGYSPDLTTSEIEWLAKTLKKINAAYVRDVAYRSTLNATERAQFVAAKERLIKELGLPEDAAYEFLNKTAMDLRMRKIEVVRKVLELDSLTTLRSKLR